MFLPPCLEPCLSWTVRRFPRFSFSFSTFRLPRRSVGYTGSVRRRRKKRTAVQPTAKLPINYVPGHTHTYPFVCLSISCPPRLVPCFTLYPSSLLTAARLPPPVVNKNRSAKLQVEPRPPSVPRVLPDSFFRTARRPCGAMSGFVRAPYNYSRIHC